MQGHRILAAAVVAVAAMMATGCAYRVVTPDIPNPVFQTRVWLLPDLIVTSVECSARSGFLLVTVTVKNTGWSEADEFDTQVELLNGPSLFVGSGSAARGALRFNATRQLGFFFDTVPYVLGQTVTIRATVDPPTTGSPGGNVREFREDNNEFSTLCNLR